MVLRGVGFTQRGEQPRKPAQVAWPQEAACQSPTKSTPNAACSLGDLIAATWSVSPEARGRSRRQPESIILQVISKSADVGGMFKKTTVVAIAVAFLGAGSQFAASAVAPSKSYRSCDDLQQRYPYGVAKNAKAANRAVREGYSRPSTSRAAKKTYWQNYTSLDRDRDGTACES